MKKAVIVSGGKQYLVAEGDTVELEKIKDADKKVEFAAIAVIDGKDSKIGAPEVKGVAVKASVVEADVKADKVTSIRYKAKKRVRTVKGHRQHKTIVKIDSIA